MPLPATRRMPGMTAGDGASAGFVGRERELEAILDAAAAAAAGRSTTILLEGSSGMGASRLIDEALRWIDSPRERGRPTGLDHPGRQPPRVARRPVRAVPVRPRSLPRGTRRRGGARPPRSRRRDPAAAAAADGRAPRRDRSSSGHPRAPGRPDPRGVSGSRRQGRGGRGPSSSSWRTSTFSTRRRGRSSPSSRGRSATGPSRSSGPTSRRPSGRAILFGPRSRPSTRAPVRPVGSRSHRSTGRPCAS